MNKNIKVLDPFHKMLITIGNLPTAYIESMSYYEGLTYLVNYLVNNVIPAVNNNGEVVKELQDKYLELVKYVDDYFSDLNIQNEINNKLDEMAEQGELTTLITSYLQMDALLMFDTKNALKGAENLADGSYAKTLGVNFYNDGLGSYYKIRELQEGEEFDNVDLVELTNYPALVAERIPDTEIDLLKRDLGTKSALNTSDKTNLVSAINEVNTKVGVLGNLTTTNQDSSVDAINEVNANVGDLSSLTTTSKTSSVSAINEVNTSVSGIISKFNISNYHNASRISSDTDTAQITFGRFFPTISTFSLNSNDVSAINCNINCATNDDGSLGKIYGIFYCTVDYQLSAANGYPCLRFRCSDFNVNVPDEGYTIVSAGVNNCSGNINSANIYIGSDGYIYLYGTRSGSTSNDTWQCVYTPSIYFFTNFGDTPEE